MLRFLSAIVGGVLFPLAKLLQFFTSIPTSLILLSNVFFHRIREAFQARQLMTGILEIFRTLFYLALVVLIKAIQYSFMLPFYSLVNVVAGFVIGFAGGFDALFSDCKHVFQTIKVDFIEAIFGLDNEISRAGRVTRLFFELQAVAVLRGSQSIQRLFGRAFERGTEADAKMARFFPLMRERLGMSQEPVGNMQAAARPNSNNGNLYIRVVTAQNSSRSTSSLPVADRVVPEHEKEKVRAARLRKFDHPRDAEQQEDVLRNNTAQQGRSFCTIS